VKKYLLTILIFSLCFGTFDFALAQTEQTITGQGIETLKKTLNEVLVIWQGAHQKVMKYWRNNILPKISQWFEKKKPVIKEDFEKEKKQLKKEIKKTFSELWQWVKDLIR